MKAIPDKANETGKTEVHIEWIKCPECEESQQAEVVHTFPFWTYIHHCDCGYIVLESEWEIVR